ncbi:hypothetical protein H0H92_014216 [Tricholoma furcatifolium]|nr:hypothetical protein H0H92_014216 [Tricholoma furcatifolium]
MSASQKDFRVAIVGGGMCGLACAVGLMKAGIHVDIFEQASKFGDIGAGVGIVMSLAEEPEPQMQGFRFISGTGDHEFICDVTKIISLLCNKKLILCQYPATPEDFGLGIYRPVFLDALMPMLDSHNVHFNRHCVSVSTLPSGAHLLHFADGSTHEADVIIGADGIKSVIREFVTGPRESQVAYSNSVAYRAVIPVETLQKAGVKTDLLRSLCWVGKDQVNHSSLPVIS